ncbi:MAG: molybdopterin-dependent oxidoreductase, partial [Actinomycetota bacterium]
PLVGNSLWMGVPLRDVLDEAGVGAGAVDVVFRCADGYSSSLPLDAAKDPNVLLAVAQNRHPLEWEHGFPCRLRAPAFYGVKNPKWITGIEVVGRDHVDYWTARGWSDVAAVRTQSRIDGVGRDSRVGRPIWITGVAWAGTRGVSKVEVSIHGGERWGEAVLNPPLSKLSWVQWAFRWTPERAGDIELLCRATDGGGALQDPNSRPPHPSGASGYHEVVTRVS